MIDGKQSFALKSQDAMQILQIDSFSGQRLTQSKSLLLDLSEPCRYVHKRTAWQAFADNYLHAPQHDLMLTHC